jgi:Transmembrane protein 131-like N-terminal/HYDIN/CFA65/VesB-like, Ig-like domain/Abnormal spindle-like microcephaly-assoc'd, ASPM-SPD-2-Hydin
MRSWLAFVLALLAAPTAARAAQYTQTLNYAGCGTACVCGAPDYACYIGCGASGFNPHSFTDLTPPGQVVTSVTVEVDGISNAPSATVEVNGVAVGPAQDPGSTLACGCSTPAWTLTDTRGIAGWSYAAPNLVSITPSTGNYCVASAVVTVTYGSPQALAAVAPATHDFGDQRAGTTGATQTFTITNSGSADLTISAANVSGPFDVTGLTVPLVIASGAQATFDVAFSPTVAGAVAGGVELVNDSTNAPSLTVSLDGRGTRSTVALAPASHDFGDQVVGTTSLALTVTVTNGGTAPLDVSSAIASGPFALVAPFTPPAIAPGDSATFDVTFAPTAPGAAAGAVTIASDDPSSPATLPLAGHGIAPALSASPASVAFGTQLIGSATTQDVTLTNSGTAPLHLSGFGIAGANPGDFAVASAPPLSAPVAAGDSVTVTVRFVPTAHGARSGRLTVASDAFGQSGFFVALGGAGYGPRIVLSPNPRDFGEANVGDGVAADVSVQNTGESTLTITSVMFSGANASDFTASASLPFTVGAGESKPFALIMAPSAVGARAATATFVSDDPLTPSAQVALTGTGTSPRIAIAPTTVDFGAELVATTSSARTVTVSNTGTGPLTISSVSIGGADAAAFAVAPVTTPLVLAPGGSQDLSVTFTPDRIAAESAALTIASDDRGTMSAVVPLDGRGVSPGIAVAPDTVDFGAQLAGRASLTINIVTITGAQAAAFAQSPPPALPAVLQPGEQLAVSVVLTPAASGAQDATLTIASDEPSGAPATVALTGVGVSTLLTVSPTVIDFGTIKAPGSSGVARTITITNGGGDALTLVDAALSGATPSAFTMDSAAGLLAPGASKTLHVTFSAAAAADYAATATFGATDGAVPAATVTMTGKAVSSLITVSPSTIDFGPVTVGANAARAVTVTNQTGAPLRLSAVASSSADFTVADADTTNDIAPGGTTSFHVTFAPAAAGAESGHVDVSIGGGGATPEQMIMVAGTGQAAPGDLGTVVVDGGGGCSCSFGGGARAPAPSAWWLAPAALVLALWLARAKRQTKRAQSRDT